MAISTMSKTTVRVSAIKVYSVLRDLEDRFNAIGATAEAERIKAQKELVLKNIGENADKSRGSSQSIKAISVGTIIERSTSIDWGQWG